MKKILAFVLVCIFAFSLVACGNNTTEIPTTEPETAEEPNTVSSGSTIKAGLICLHDENSGYDANFITAFKNACEATGVEAVVKTLVGENSEAYEAASMLADDGCSVVFADSYGHQQFILQAAQEYPNTQFTSCTGDMANSAGVENYHNAFATIFQGRFLAGIAAGLKLNEMIEDGKITPDEAIMGYVGALPYAEVISGYTSFYLGAKYVCPTVTMNVIYTGSWFDETAEKEAANALMNAGAVLISQHADSMGAPNACESAGVPNVSYNGSTLAACPNSYIISSRINWEPYFTYAIESVKSGSNYATDWCGTIDAGSVELTELNESVAAHGTKDMIESIEKSLLDGSLHVFDTATWTKDGEMLTSYDKVAFYEGNECIWDGYFHESETRSAPYFDIIIDGITILG